MKEKGLQEADLHCSDRHALLWIRTTFPEAPRGSVDSHTTTVKAEQRKPAVAVSEADEQNPGSNRTALSHPQANTQGSLEPWWSRTKPARDFSFATGGKVQNRYGNSIKKSYGPLSDKDSCCQWFRPAQRAMPPGPNLSFEEPWLGWSMFVVNKNAESSSTLQQTFKETGISARRSINSLKSAGFELWFKRTDPGVHLPETQPCSKGWGRDPGCKV